MIIRIGLIVLIFLNIFAWSMIFGQGRRILQCEIDIWHLKKINELREMGFEREPEETP